MAVSKSIPPGPADANKDGACPLHRASNVFALPTASKSVVVQPARRGRLPSSVKRLMHCSTWTRAAEDAMRPKDRHELVSQLAAFRDTKVRTMSTLDWIDERIKDLERQLRAEI